MQQAQSTAPPVRAVKPDTMGVLLTNLGTPEAPTKRALRVYLKEFLSDRRVVDVFRPLWWLILNGIVLNTRPAKSAHAYRQIWLACGSPLLVTSNLQRKMLQRELETRLGCHVPVALGMRYGTPTIDSALSQLKDCKEIRILPLYPQYAGATIGSTYDAVFAALQKLDATPSITTISGYPQHPTYIDALCNSILAYAKKHGTGEHLLFSFHGLPQRYVDCGDPYQEQCFATAEAVAKKLALSSGQYTVAFQSRFGREVWLKPYTDEALVDLARRGLKRVDVVAPGFSVDCLETLEEIDMGYRELFLSSGGQSFHYIPALNAKDDHISMMADIILKKEV